MPSAKNFRVYVLIHQPFYESWLATFSDAEYIYMWGIFGVKSVPCSDPALVRYRITSLEVVWAADQ